MENSSPKQCEDSWNRFKTFYSDNELPNPTLIDNNTVKNMKLCLTFKCYAEGMGFKTTEAARSGITHCYSRTLKVDNGWKNASFIGDPCDSNETKDHITSIKKTS